MSSKNFYGLTGDVTIDGGILNVANTNVSGNVTSTSLFVSNVATLGTTKTFVVTVDNSKYVIDGDSQASLELHEGQTYIFDITVPNASSHPFKISQSQEHPGAVYQNGVDGYNTNYIKFTVPFGAPTTLYYYCESHTGMGGQINISPAAELVVSGRIVASGNVEASKITASANVEVTGNVVASKFVGDGSLLTSVTAETTSGLQVVTDNSPTTTNTIQFTNPTTSLTASSNIVATGNVTADHFIGDGSRLSGIVTSVTFGDAVDTGNVSSNTLLLTNTKEGLVATGNIVTQGKFIGDGSELTGIVTSVNLSDAVDTGNTTSNTVQFTNTSTSLTASGNVEVSGNVIAGYFIGDGSRLTGISGGSGGTSHWTKDAVTNQLHYSTGSVGISNTNPAHDLSVGSNLYIDDDATDGVLMVTGNVHGTYFVGDGSRLINLPEGGGSTNWTTSGNPVNKIYYPQNPGTTSVSVGIMNAAPAHTLSVGSNLFVDDAGSNVLVVDGNITAESMFLGALGIKPAYPLDSVTDTGNVTPHTISFTNPTLGITTASNVEIGGALVVGKGTLGGSNLEVGEANLFVNTDLTRVGIATDQPAATLHVNGSLAVDGPLTFGTVDVAAQHGLEAITAVDNTTPLTIELQNADTSLVTTGNVEVGGNVITSKDLTVTGNVTTNSELIVAGNVFYTNLMSVSVKSNVVTEYTGPHDRPLRKYPEVALTQNDESATSGYVASGSDRLSASYEYYEAFDLKTNLTDNNTANTGLYNAWLSPDSRFDSNGDADLTTSSTFPGTSYRGEYCALKLPKAIKLDNFHIFPRGDASSYANSNPPKDLRIFGSNDGTTWTHIKQFQNLGFTGRSGLRLHVNDSNTYNEYAFFVEKITVSSGGVGYCAIGGIELYGYEEGSGSLDTTLKTVYNVPATTGTQLEVYYDAKDLVDMPNIVTDLSPNTNGGSVTGVTLDETGGIDSFKFATSSSQYIEKVFSGYTQSTEYSASVWFKSDSYTADSYIFQLGLGDHSNGSGIGMNIESEGPLRAYIYGYGSSSQVSTSVDSIATGTWYHATATYYSSGKIELYINGVLVGEGKATQLGTINAAAPLTLGTYYVNSTRQTPSFNGSIANFRLYSKALNADQVKELYDYQKDYFLGSKSQVTLYKGHLGVGVTEPSGQLELAGDERLQEYPPKAMTGYETLIPGHGVFCASASSYYGTYYPWNAFDKNTTDDSTQQAVWHTLDDFTVATPGIYKAGASLGGYTGAWLKLKLPYSIKPSKVSIHPRTYPNGVSDFDQNPKDFLILGSKDDNTWDVLSTQTDVVFGTTWKDFTLSPGNNTYNYFAISCTKNKYGAFFAINDMKYFGTPGPTTLDKGSLSLTRSLDVPRVSRYDVDTETPRPEKLVVDFDTTVNSTPTDISGKGNHGRFNGAADYSVADKAFVFDGTSDCNISGNHNLSGSNPVHTISGWIKKTSTNTGWEYLFTIGTSSVGKMSGFTMNSGDLYFSIYGDGVAFNTPDNFNNNWQHIVGVYTGGTTLTPSNFIIYVNGVKVQTTSGNGNTFTLTGNQVTLGTNTNGGEEFIGQISNFKLYNVALEPSEVKKLYRLGRTGRSMIISDTAVGIGKVPESNFDVRGAIYSTRQEAQSAIVRSREDSSWAASNQPYDGKGFTIAREENPLGEPGADRYWQFNMHSNYNLHIASNGRHTCWITQNANDVSLNFTGQHRCFIKDVPFTQAKELEGLVVSSDQNKYIKMNDGIEKGSNAITTNESLPIVSLSKTQSDKKCFGVISSAEDSEIRSDQYGVFNSIFVKEKGDTRVYINSVGEGAIWVANTNGSLEAGDYITTSNVAGYGQKQDSEFLTNYTVAKITMDCDFNPETQPIQIIKRDETGENILDEHGQIQWEDDPSGATEKAYKIRYLDADGNITDEANAVHTAAFVGCTYHCG